MRLAANRHSHRNIMMRSCSVVLCVTYNFLIASRMRPKELLATRIGKMLEFAKTNLILGLPGRRVVGIWLLRQRRRAIADCHLQSSD